MSVAHSSATANRTLVVTDNAYGVSVINDSAASAGAASETESAPVGRDALVRQNQVQMRIPCDNNQSVTLENRLIEAKLKNNGESFCFRYTCK